MTTFIARLNAADLKAIAWYYANEAVNTDKRNQRLINFFSMNKSDLQNHITNTIGITQILNTELNERRVTWNRCKDTAKEVLNDLINNPPANYNNNNNSNNNSNSNNSDNNNNSNNNNNNNNINDNNDNNKGGGDQQQNNNLEEILVNSIWRQLTARMESMNQQTSDKNNKSNKNSKQQKRGREDNDEDEEINTSDDDEDETERKQENISISNKRAKQYNGTTAPTLSSSSSAQSNSTNYSGGSMNITNNNFHHNIGHQTPPLKNILSQAIPEFCPLDTDLMEITQSIMEKAKAGQYTNTLTHLLQRKKSWKGSGSEDNNFSLKANRDGTVRMVDEDGETTSSALGQKRQLDSFSRLAEVMIHVLIGKIYRDDQRWSIDILSLFSLAISIDRTYSWRTALYYVEAALTKKRAYPAFDIAKIDTEILSSVSRRANDINNTYGDNSNNSRNNSYYHNQIKPHNKWNNDHNTGNASNNTNDTYSNNTKRTNSDNAIPVCRNFNRYKQCSHGSKCIFQHICSMCGDKKHGASTCPAKSKDSEKKNGD
jgi:hypothetical protein